MTRAHLDHVHLAATDIERAAAFYCSAFGAAVLARYEYEGSRSIAIDLGGTRVNFRQRKSVDEAALDHLGIGVVDLEATWRRLQSADADLTREPRPWEPTTVVENHTGRPMGGNFAFLRGPAGELIELVERF
jgi:catechol 2,3-dioxygenase-like lactoylglutathione lyase family enzyme